MRYARRTDKNHQEIREAFRTFSDVRDTSRCGDGVLDLEVTHAGQVYFVEIKSKNGKVTPKQRAFIRSCNNAFIVRSKEDVFLFVNDKTSLRIKTLSTL